MNADIWFTIAIASSLTVGKRMDSPRYKNHRHASADLIVAVNYNLKDSESLYDNLASLKVAFK